MIIEEIIQNNNSDIYKRLMQICKVEKSKKKIELGDSPQNLMKSDSYKRIRGALRQRIWSK